jgi:hypothetical protein
MDAIGSDGEAYVKAWSTSGPAILATISAAFAKKSTSKQEHEKQIGITTIMSEQKHGNERVVVHTGTNLPVKTQNNEGAEFDDAVRNAERDEIADVDDDAKKEHEVNIYDEEDEEEEKESEEEAERAAASHIPLPELKSDGRSHERGASFLKQVWLFHQRSLYKQQAMIGDLIVEMIVCL